MIDEFAYKGTIFRYTDRLGVCVCVCVCVFSAYSAHNCRLENRVFYISRRPSVRCSVLRHLWHGKATIVESPASQQYPYNASRKLAHVVSLVSSQWRIQIFWKGGDNLSAPPSFIANVHNEIYAFYTKKTAF